MSACDARMHPHRCCPRILAVLNGAGHHNRVQHDRREHPLGSLAILTQVLIAAVMLVNRFPVLLLRISTLSSFRV